MFTVSVRLCFVCLIVETQHARVRLALLGGCVLQLALGLRARVLHLRK